MAGEIAITFDDAPAGDSQLMTREQRAEKIIGALQARSVPDTIFFVTTKYIDANGDSTLRQYVNAGFHLANHSHSHRSANDMTVEDYLADVQHAKTALKKYDNVLPLHRFPYLHYGKQRSVRALQKGLDNLDYSNGYVTVDNYEWYINAVLAKAVSQGREVDLEAMGNLYVELIWECIQFYDRIAVKALGRSPKHVLLLHENDAAALYLPKLIDHIKEQGWEIISPQAAYQDPIAHSFDKSGFPSTGLHSQGRVAAIAHAQGEDAQKLRHPSEDTDYIDALVQSRNIVK
ncbi:polysaccharide deacetylase family protein [bacterium SCSIO 12696]|nr:polysaccharide deacetylase family protein [bacterium SCSIO 12696]